MRAKPTRPPARRWIAGPALALLVLLGACVTSGGGSFYVDPEGGPTAGMSVAVLPFENLSTYPKAGLIVSQIVRSELYSRGTFSQQEESETRARLARKRIDPSRLGETVDAAKVAEALGVDAVLAGSVTEFRYQSGLKQEPAIGVAARLVGRDGKVLWSANQSMVGGSLFTRLSLTEAARGLIGRMIGKLAIRAR